MSQKKLFLLDGMALIYRAFFAFSQNPRITSYGLNTNAMFGFVNTLLDVINKQKPTHIAVVFDTSAPTERHEVYEAYKAHREQMPEDLSKSIPYIFKIIEAFNIPVITLDGYEADDIIGTIALRDGSHDCQVYMMTPDKDFGQLVNENVFIFKPARMGNDYEIMGVNEVLKKWEIEHIHQVIDILAIWGDAVDNIPGIPGMGEKTAKKLIQEYGSLENILANTDKFKGKQQENLINFKEQAILSKHLATININVPINHNLDDYELRPYNNDAIREIFAELEFRNLTKRVLGEEVVSVKSTAQVAPVYDLFNQPQSSSDDKKDIKTIVENDAEEPSLEVFNHILNTVHDYHLVQSDLEKKELIENILQQTEFCFDTETDGLDVLNCKIVGLALSYKKSEAYYVPINEAEELQVFKPLFESSLLKIAQNLKFDLQVLHAHGIEVKMPFYDTMLAHYIVEPDKRHNMDDLSRHYLQYDPVSIETLIGKKGKNQLNMGDIDLEKVKEYAAEDADVTFQLKTILDHELIAQNGKKLFDTIEMPLVPVLAKMEREGIRIDSAFLNQYSVTLGKEVVEAENKVYELAGEHFNIASPLQLGKILFDKLQLDPKAKKTKTGQYQTGEDVLQKLSSKSDIVKYILEFRGLQKLKSTYVDALPALVNPKTGRVHTTFNQSIAATGRLSSTNPNIQNIPIRTEQGREVRKAFIPRNDDFLILSADYSQIELRVIASISEDEGMMDAFSKSIDIHSATAAKVFGVPLEEVSKEQRYKAKSVNFGLIYGQGAFGLAENLGISRTEAKAIIDNYFIQFPGIRNYMEMVKEQAKRDGFVETILGRRRYLRDINSANATVRAFAERNAINAPIQGTAADMIKLAMIKIHEEMNQQQLKSKMLIQVHDELVFDAHKDELDLLTNLVKTAMQNALPLKVPVIAEAGWGENWLVAH
ncbi:MAG: DNA polymerase I [Bacteroidota bacterium]|nr:DNA polymerase I [Bacteroidota bacterium]